MSLSRAGLTDTNWHQCGRYQERQHKSATFINDGITHPAAAYGAILLLPRTMAQPGLASRAECLLRGGNSFLVRPLTKSDVYQPGALADLGDTSDLQFIQQWQMSLFPSHRPPNAAIQAGASGRSGKHSTWLWKGRLRLYYQWSFNGGILNGATNSSLVLTNVQDSQAGIYSVEITNAAGSVTSSNAVLTVGVPPSITTQPIGITNLPGTTATFSVVASGDSPLAYQWSFNGNSISGATNSSLILSNVQLNQSGSYAVMVTNAFGSIASSSASLTVEVAPVITQQPVNATNGVGTTASFVVAASGTSPLAYQWSFNGNSISGATSSSLVFTDVQYSQAGSYSVVVTNVYGSAISSNATLTVVAAPCVPAPLGGGEFNTTMAAWWAGEDNVDDAFMVNNGTLGSGVSFAPGEVGQAFDFSPGNSGVVIPASPSLHVGQYDNYYDLSLGIEAWIKPTDISTAQPIIQWNNGSGMSLWISANGPGSLSFYLGQGYPSLSSPPGLIDTNSFHHVAVIYAGYGGNAPCTLYVDGVLVASNNFGAQAISDGQVTLGFSTPSSRFVGLIDEVGVYSYLADPTYIQSIYNAGSMGRCRSLPNITSPPGDQSVLAGANATFTVGVASSPFPWGYQWQFNGANIPGANSNPLILSNVQPANAGAYSVIVTNAFGPVTSSSANLTVVTTLVSIITQPASQTATVGNDATFTVVASGSGPYSYQWLFQGTNIAGASGSSFTVNAQPATSGAYDVLVSNPASSILSSNATLSLQPAACQPPPSGLLAWWPADGHARDIVGGNDGVLRGGVVFGPGKVGQDFSFASSGYVSVPDGTNWSFGTNDFSIELWASFNSIQTDNFFIGHDEGVSGTNRWSFGLNSGSLQFQMSSASGISSSSFTPIIGNYYHLTVTQTGGIYTFYVNGVPMGSVTNSTPVPVAHAPLTFGQSGGQGYLNGQLDEIAIYNRALLPSEILGIYTASTAGKCESSSAPVITSQPADQTVTAGANVTLGAQIASLQPLSCQWYFNSMPVNGATNLSLTLYSVSTNQAGSYQLVASNGLGSVSSRPAHLTVLPNTNINNGQPIIVVQPQSRMYLACDPAILSVTATGNGPLSYQWYLNGTLLSGSNTPTLSIPGVTPTSAGTYQVVVSNGAGSTTSSNAVISIVPGSLLYFNNFSGGGLMGPFGTVLGAGTASDSTAPSPPSVAAVGTGTECGFIGMDGIGPVNTGFNTSNGGTIGYWALIPWRFGLNQNLTVYCGTSGYNATFGASDGTAIAVSEFGNTWL